MTTTVVPDVLRKAADIIDQRGWSRRRDVATDGSGFCANGAIRVALGHEVYGYDKKALGAPLEWTEAQRLEYSATLRRIHSTLDEYLDTRVEMDDVSSLDSLLPHIALFNDIVARDKHAVTGVLRDTASWLERNATDALTAVEKTNIETELVSA